MKSKVTDTKYEGMTSEEKRALVLMEGTRIKQFVCPLCGLNRVIEKRDKGRIRFDHVDLMNGLLLQERACGGRNSGFYLDRDSSLTLPEVTSIPEYQDLLDQIKDQCRAILKVLE